jgi:pimeloyl-ACP methyl ester carboxylesterase
MPLTAREEGLAAVAPSPAVREAAPAPVGLAAEPTSEPVLARPALDWRPCGQFADRDIECAELDVPIDYAQPSGEQVTLALRRILANPLEPRRGALLYNPGGPGGDGIDSALSVFRASLFEQIAPGFDIIGFDPRGVAQSGERGCGIEAPDPYAGVAGDVELSFADVVGSYRAEGEDCEQEWGPLFRKLGSNNVVRDMEEIRKALNEPLLNFYGISYGTRLGALYAHAYPETTGRIVLDAPVSPRGSYIEMVRDQFYESLELHERFLSDCEAGTQVCTPNARQVFGQALANAQARGIGESFAFSWALRLASLSGLQSLRDALAAEAATPGGDWILRFVASGPGVGFVPYASVTCSDDTLKPPTLEEMARLQDEFELASPIFGGQAERAAMCAGWPTTPDPVPLPTATQGPALLVIGGLFDSRTPYAWSVAMTETLGNATLLTSAHWGHGALGTSDCVQFMIRAYLTSGSMPAAGSLCE